MTGQSGESRVFRVSAWVEGKRMQGSVTRPDGASIRFTLTKGPSGTTNIASGEPAVEEPHPTGPEPRPLAPREAILAALDRYEVVAIGSVSHGTQDLDGFILDLFRDPRLPGKVNDIAVECGNALYQPILDRYIGGEDIPLAQARAVWRNTTQPNCGFSPFYDQFFPLVRRVNRSLPPNKKLRVLACDPPVDWSAVHGPKEAMPFRDRDRSIAQVMEREVLARHRKALMLFGINHIRHGMAAVGRYEASYPGVTLVVAEHHGFGGMTPFARYNDVLEQRMASWPVPSLVMLKGTWLDDLESLYFDPDYVRSEHRGYPGVDAYLYLGPRDLLLMEPAPARTVLDTAYISELRRRAAAVGEPHGPSDPAVTFRRELESSVFLEN